MTDFLEYEDTACFSYTISMLQSFLEHISFELIQNIPVFSQI